MRLLVFALLFLAGCTDSQTAQEGSSIIEFAGRLQYKPLDEASGLAWSGQADDLLWAVNDGGAAVVYGIGADGSKRGKVGIHKAGHRDWEDMEAFTLGGKSYLLIADIGDNDAERKDVSLYIVEEPHPGEKEVDIGWRIDFSYPDGPRDAEAIAVDADNELIYVLSKRDIPAHLYSLPLRPGTNDTITAQYVGLFNSLPQPTRADVNAAPLTNDRHWQPTGMAIAPDGKAALVLTYGAIYYYARAPGETWTDALGHPPLRLVLRRLPGAESITFSSSGMQAWVTTEGRQAPLLRVDLEGVR
jgi:hypothetical protein